VPSANLLALRLVDLVVDRGVLRNVARESATVKEAVADATVEISQGERNTPRRR